MLTLRERIYREASETDLIGRIEEVVFSIRSFDPQADSLTLCKAVEGSMGTVRLYPAAGNSRVVVLMANRDNSERLLRASQIYQDVLKQPGALDTVPAVVTEHADAVFVFDSLEV